jgi:hypothetical protein
MAPRLVSFAVAMVAAPLAVAGPCQQPLTGDQQPPGSSAFADRCAGKPLNLKPAVVGLHLHTWHDQKGYRSSTPGIYARWESGLTVGVLRNSFGRPGAYIGWTWGDRAAVTAGGITGYKQAIRPLVVPSIRVGWVRQTLLPKADPKGATGVHTSIEAKLGEWK